MMEFITNPAVIWIAIAVILAIIEGFTLGLTTIWFAGGALAAAITTIWHAPIWFQILAFIVVSGVLLLFTRPVAKEYFNNKTVKTNVEAIIGNEGIAETDIRPHEIGQVKADGKVWSATCEDGTIPKGSVVVIKKIKGVTVTVEKKEG